MYKIVVSEALNLVEAHIEGFLSVAEVLGYATDLTGQFTIGRLRPDYIMLLDVSQASIQSQEVIAALQQQVRAMPMASRLVVVTGCSAIRLQMRRVLREMRVVMVGPRDEAMLLLGQRPARAA